MCAVPILVSEVLLERFVWKSVEAHTELAFGAWGISGIVLEQRRSSQFGRLPGGSPPSSPRSLPLRIRLIKIFASFANRLLTISGSRLNTRDNSRGLQDPDEAFLSFI